MKRRSLLTVLAGLVLLTLFGCGKETAGDGKTAQEYVESRDYSIISSKGEVDSYILDKSKFYGGTETIPYQQMWGVQKEKPDAYIGKRITIYGFTVSNHPLEKVYKVKTNVYIMMAEGKVIGGYSFPDAEMNGSYYSLDGKTLEEVSG